MGPSATWSALKSYWPIPVWALGFQLLSLALALALKTAGIVPAAFVPSFCFNNVTSLPLLLIESLSASGSLDGLAVGDESASALLKKGRVYFLCVSSISPQRAAGLSLTLALPSINALVSNISRFAFGPALMSPSTYHESNFLPSTKQDKADADEASDDLSEQDDDARPQDDESAPLLPRQARGGQLEAGVRRVRRSKLGAIARKVAEALNPPLVGGLLAILCGMIPPIRHIVFEKGWAGWVDPLTQAVSKLGALFTGLQM
jgi:predicted permease